MCGILHKEMFRVKRSLTAQKLKRRRRESNGAN